MTKQLTDLDIGETSGVDHPAHLEEGWLLMKSKDGLAAQVAEVLKDSTSTCPECNATVPAGDQYCPECGAKMPSVSKAAGDATDRLRKLHSVIGQLIDQGGEMSEEQTSVEKEEGAEEATETTEDELMKSLPDSVRELITKERERSDRLEKTLADEVSRRQADEAISKAAGWSSIGIDTAEFAPKLQQLRSLDPELAAEFEKALDAAQTVAETSKVFEVIGSPMSKAGNALETLTREYMAKNADADYATAQAAVLGTPEGERAYAEVAAETKKGV